MRIARGLFLLWLVVSVVWIAGVGTSTWLSYAVPQRVADETASQSTGKFIEVRTPDGMIHQFTADTASDVVDRTMRNYWLWHEAENAAKVGLIPPVLVIGSALGWTLKGFKH
jgi:hypothetical protein